MGKWEKTGLCFFLKKKKSLLSEALKKDSIQIIRFFSKVIVSASLNTLWCAHSADERFFFFLPEWHFFLWNVHIVTNKKSFRIFSFPIRNNTAIKFGNWRQSVSQNRHVHFKVLKIFTFSNKNNWSEEQFYSKYIWHVLMCNYWYNPVWQKIKYQKQNLVWYFDVKLTIIITFHLSK